MFNSITWTNYILVILLLATAYYLFIGIRFYSHNLKNRLSGLLKPERHFQVNQDFTSAPQSIKTELSAEQSFANTSEDTFHKIEELINQIKEAIEEGSRERYVKDEFISSLGKILKDHSVLKGSTLQSAIQELINSECEKLGFYTLSEKEMSMVWE